MKEIILQDPEPVEAWTEALDATKDGPHCPQFDYFDLYVWNWGDIEGEEDCLTLNVFTPKVRIASGKTKFCVTH